MESVIGVFFHQEGVRPWGGLSPGGCLSLGWSFTRRVSVLREVFHQEGVCHWGGLLQGGLSSGWVFHLRLAVVLHDSVYDGLILCFTISFLQNKDLKGGLPSAASV